MNCCSPPLATRLCLFSLLALFIDLLRGFADFEEGTSCCDASSMHQNACRELCILLCNEHLRKCSKSHVSLSHENFKYAQYRALMVVRRQGSR